MGKRDPIVRVSVNAYIGDEHVAFWVMDDDNRPGVWNKAVTRSGRVMECTTDGGYFEVGHLDGDLSTFPQQLGAVFA